MNGLLNDQITIFLLVTFHSRFFHADLVNPEHPPTGFATDISDLLLQSIFVEVRVKDGSHDRKSKARNGCARFRLRSFFTARRTSGVRIILGLYVYICTHTQKYTRTHKYKQKTDMLHTYTTLARRAYVRVARVARARERVRVCMYHYCITAVG